MLPIDRLISVRDLIAKQQDQCSILIEWEPPFLLPGLSVSYKVYIDEKIVQDDTNYVYCPEELTNATYDVVVKAFNGSIIGDAARDFGTFEVCK